MRTIARLMLALLYAVAGAFHLAAPGPFVAIMPGWVPEPEAVVSWTGIAELLGAVALAQPLSAPLRRAGAIGLAFYAVAVFPANTIISRLIRRAPMGAWALPTMCRGCWRSHCWCGGRCGPAASRTGRCAAGTGFSSCVLTQRRSS